MAGYNYRRGMSRNAVDAYRRNLKPISRFTAQDLRDADLFKLVNVAAAHLLIRLMSRHVQENRGHAWVPQDSVHSLERIARDKASPVRASMLRNLPKPPPISLSQATADTPQRRYTQNFQVMAKTVPIDDGIRAWLPEPTNGLLALSSALWTSVQSMST